MNQIPHHHSAAHKSQHYETCECGAVRSVNYCNVDPFSPWHICSLCVYRGFEHVLRPARLPKRQAVLRNWSIEKRRELGVRWAHLEGFVYGHPKLEDGLFITTSPLLRLDIPGHSAETMNTIYTLEDETGCT